MNVTDFDITRYEDGALKQILWQLCYKPLETAFKLGFGECDEEELKNFILTKAKEEGRLLDFAGEEPSKETFGVDIGIKNPIVRDYIIEKCHAVALINNGEIEKILRLLKTEDNGNIDSTRRIHGALREMDFNRDEASYIQETCSIYPIYLLLQRINQDLLDYIESSIDSEDFEPEDNVMNNDMSDNVIVEITDIVDEEMDKQENVTVHQLIVNSEAIKEVLKLIEKLEKKLEPLEAAGITPEYIYSKKDYLNDLYNAIEQLNN